jgi:diguanylate cyclase (GGDEF)-like protein
MKKSLTQFIQMNESQLRERWKSSVELLASHIGHFQQDTGLFQEIAELMMSLILIVENKESAEQAVDAQLRPVISHLRNLQSKNHLNSTRMVLLLFLMRDILRETLRDLSGMSPELGRDRLPYEEAQEQVSNLLKRLGLVFFENAMRLTEEDGKQDVLAIEYALLYERTRQIAITDRLTGLHNFGYFFERLKEEKMRAERYHRLLSLVLFDIDHFKKYNDANGHPAGNEVLKKIASMLRSEAREVDIVARYGGEEMVMVLPETGRKRATELADRIREKIASTVFAHMESQPLKKITVSAGVATYPVDAATEEELIKKADTSLYEAKSGGRNRVVAFRPPMTLSLVYKPSRPVGRAALVGNFNNWDKEVDPMVRQDDGSFKFDLALEPGVYHYKFVLDGTDWIVDPANPERSMDSLGGENSVLRVQGG